MRGPAIETGVSEPPIRKAGERDYLGSEGQATSGTMAALKAFKGGAI
jgi:hypothetical protein